MYNIWVSGEGYICEGRKDNFPKSQDDNSILTFVTMEEAEQFKRFFEKMFPEYSGTTQIVPSKL